MLIKDENIKKFYKELTQSVEGDYKIILEPERELREEWIEYDVVKWQLEKPVQDLVNKLQTDTTLNFEEKIIEIHKCLCFNYIYDDNVLFFFRRDDTDPENVKYIAVDWYGRITGEKWFQNRQHHNRRICYEFSRIYAKAINMLIGENDELEAFVIGYTDNTHYVVGLTGKDYSAILDPDDFNKIKDLTRLKLGLTLDGINILRDETGRLKSVVENFNKDRLEELKEVESLNKEDKIEYLKRIVYILRTYNIDSQGFMEYMRAKVEKEEIEIEKIWKEIKGGPEKRYVRCLVFEYNGKKYLLDSVEQTLNEVNIDELDKNIFIFKPEENEYAYYGG